MLQETPNLRLEVLRDLILQIVGQITSSLTAIQPNHIEQPLVLQLQFLIDLPPNPQPRISIPTMWHRLILPNTIEIPASTLPSLIFTTLRLRIRSTLRRRSNIHQRHTPLLDIDSKDRRHKSEEYTDQSDQPKQPGVVLRYPDTTRDISRVKSIHGDVSVLFVL